MRVILTCVQRFCDNWAGRPSQVSAAVVGPLHIVVADPFLDGGAREMRVVVKEIRRHEVCHKATTMVLQEVVDEDKIRIAVPVNFSGTLRAVAANVAPLIASMSTMLVLAKVKDLPDSIEIDLSGMKQNDRILASDLKLPEGVTPVISQDAVVASTVQLRGMADFEEEKEAAPAD